MARDGAASGYLVISGHDFRSSRKANIHFITECLAQRGPVRMFSLAFSPLSTLKGSDPRLGLESRVNRPETVNGVECYLWRTWLHPFNPRIPLLQALSPLAYETYRALAPDILRRWVRQSHTVVVESGNGVLLIRDIKRWNPEARIIYSASDDMKTLGNDPYLLRVFARSAPLIESARLPSRRLAASIPPGPKLFFAPQGIDLDMAKHADPNPYPPGIHAISVGSMLFDPSFFETATVARPDVTFHVIGSGQPPGSLPTAVVDHGELPFRATLPYLKHANIGIAPYRRAAVPEYLCDTSMKLIQYGFFGLPAACPNFVVGDDHPLRFGYEPGDAGSIAAALERALASEHRQSGHFLSWSEVTDRLLAPDDFPDTRMSA